MPPPPPHPLSCVLYRVPGERSVAGLEHGKTRHDNKKACCNPPIRRSLQVVHLRDLTLELIVHQVLHQRLFFFFYCGGKREGNGIQTTSVERSRALPRTSQRLRGVHGVDYAEERSARKMGRGRGAAVVTTATTAVVRSRCAHQRCRRRLQHK